MFSKINHVAIVSENYAKSALFYQAVFGMRTSDKARPGRAQTVGDGYVGLNINPRRAGRAAGLDHFGIEVEDAETAFERMRKKYPSVKWLKRPSNRPFAGISTHDPDGNMFDISQKNMAQPHLGLSRAGRQRRSQSAPHRSRGAAHHAAGRDGGILSRRVRAGAGNKGDGDRNHYLTDGHMTLVIMPWDITDYDGTGIITAGMDHIGFKVESVDKLKEDVERIAADNPLLAPAPLGTGAEGKALLELFRRSCPLGQHQMADCDGVLIDVAAD